MPTSEGVPKDNLQVLEEHDWVDSIVRHATQPGPETLLQSTTAHHAGRTIKVLGKRMPKDHKAAVLSNEAWLLESCRAAPF